MTPQELPASPSAAGAAYAEMRAQPRFALLIRCAKLATPAGEFLCIVRDVSEGGVRLRFFHPVPAQGPMALVLSSGESFAMERAWAQGDQAGFRFAEPIDVHRFIAEAGPFPKRPVRLRVAFPAVVVADGEAHAASVLDISRQGARVVTERPLALGQKLRLEADSLPAIGATVCWRNAPDYGLVLDRVFTLEELARHAAQLQLGSNWPVEASGGQLRHA